MSMAQYKMGGGQRVSRIQDLIAFYETERPKTTNIEPKTAISGQGRKFSDSSQKQASTEGLINLPTNYDINRLGDSLILGKRTLVVLRCFRNDKHNTILTRKTTFTFLH